MPNHGVFISEAATSVSTPNVANSGIPFVVGRAPLDGDNAVEAGIPVLCTSWAEYVDKLGDNSDWAKYTLCEFAYSHFKLFGCQPVIFLPIAPAEGQQDITAAQVAAGFESVELCLTMFGIVPDLLVAPGFSDTAAVAAAMAVKAEGINGMFKAKALVDISGSAYTDAISAKNSGTFTAEQIVCWPFGKIDTMKFHMSTLVAGRMAQKDTDNGGMPYESPSNKAVKISGICKADGTEVNISLAQANLLNAAGIVTSINFMGGYVIWGNYTGCYPASADVKDYFIPVSRMFGWVGNSLIKTFWAKQDKPMNRRLIDSILDSANIWLNGLVGMGYLLGARVEMLEEENPLTNLMAGQIKLHVYMTPPSPAQEIDFVLEYDADYVTSALQS